MKNIEWNKIMAAVLLPGIAILIIGNIVDALYMPEYVKSDYVVPEVEGKASTNAVQEALNIPNLLMSANLEKGKIISKKCASCHTFDKGGLNRVGPNLWNIVGAKHAHLASYNYSRAMSSSEGSWTYEGLFHYLQHPQKVVPGTKMSFAGIPKYADLASLILYLRSMSDNPHPLPTE